MLALIIATCTGVFAGILGAILGLGGGAVVVPALEFFMAQIGHSFTLTEAVAVSQVGVLAVGLSGAAAYLRRGLVHWRFGYLLMPYTIFGGLLGSILGLILPTRVVMGIFAVLLLYSAYHLLYPVVKVSSVQGQGSAWTRPAMLFSGVMSGLLGIGGGTVQVPVLHLLSGIPLREAVATSTFLMGLTAVVNIAVYQMAGVLRADLAVAVAVGVLVGAQVGAALQHKMSVSQLKGLFVVLLLFVSVRLIWKSFGGE